MASELRYKILDQSLKIENALGSILSKVIRVEQGNSKTLSNKSSAIPFKVKVDFLYDLKRISTDEYNLLILFMEIRNQLIHNIEVDTLEKALTAINKKAKLLSLDNELAKRYANSPTEELKEDLLDLLLSKLEMNLISILKSQYEKLIKDLELEQDTEIRVRAGEANEKLVKIFMEVQKIVASKFADTFSEDEIQREEWKNLIATLFYKEFKVLVEAEFGEIDI